MEQYTLSDFIFDSADKAGFKVVSCTGAPMHERIVFENPTTGERRVVQCGITPIVAKPRNIRVKLSGLPRINYADCTADMAKSIVIKVNYSDRADNTDWNHTEQLLIDDKKNNQ